MGQMGNPLYSWTNSFELNVLLTTCEYIKALSARFLASHRQQTLRFCYQFGQKAKTVILGYHCGLTSCIMLINFLVICLSLRILPYSLPSSVPCYDHDPEQTFFVFTKTKHQGYEVNKNILILKTMMPGRCVT